MVRGEKGHILMHVLITAVIISVITAGITRMLLVRYVILNRATTSAQKTRTTTAGVNRVLTIWAQSGIVCSDATAAGYTCTPTETVAPGNAACKCCPTDITSDAALTFSGGALCVETPDPNTGSYTADTSGGTCPDITCP
jgi:hypothetical protein